MYAVRPYTAAAHTQYLAHFARSVGESGVGEPHFNPFEPGSPDLPKGDKLDGLALAGSDTGWLRLWLAWADDSIVGHLDLKGAALAVGRHRCLLGIGIERAHRGRGVGRLLMQAAIDYARAQPDLDYIDLSVFSHNSGARALYQKLGFVEQGVLVDKFRIGGESIDDVLMTLDLRRV